MKKLRKLLTIAALGILYSLPFFTLPGGGQAFIAFKDDKGAITIPGESKEPGYEDWIEVENFGWEARADILVDAKGGQFLGSEFGDLNFEHRVDLASPLLALKCVSGQRIPRAEISVLGENGLGNLAEVISMRFINVFISAVSDSGDTNSASDSSESVQFAYEKIEMTVNTYKSGTKSGTSEFRWDRVSNKSY